MPPSSAPHQGSLKPKPSPPNPSRKKTSSASGATRVPYGWKKRSAGAPHAPKTKPNPPNPSPPSANAPLPKPTSAPAAQTSTSPPLPKHWPPKACCPQANSAQSPKTDTPSSPPRWTAHSYPAPNCPIGQTPSAPFQAALPPSLPTTTQTGRYSTPPNSCTAATNRAA